MKFDFFQSFFSTTASEKALNWQYGFQVPASPVAEGIINFHHDLFFFLVVIITFVFYVLFRCLSRYGTGFNGEIKHHDNPVSFSHAPILEIVWTIIPALILIVISIPSFSLLYSIDEVLQALFNIKVVGHQWYWSYEILNAEYVFKEMFNSNIMDYLKENYSSLADKLENNYDASETIISYDSYMRTEENIADKRDRLLAVDNKVYVPVEANVRVLVTAADVLHCWAVPALGVKMDACPGRLNQTSIFAKRPGTFYGQCSEICGINHGFMPINVTAVDIVGDGLRIKEGSKGLAAIYEFLVKQKVAA